MEKTFSFEDFKELAKNDNEFRDEIIGKNDIIDLDNGTMIIYAEHLNKYLEQYACKDRQDLEDTLWYSYGVWVKII